MHIKLEGKALREALSKAGPVATRAAGYAAEMHSSAKLEARADSLTITATNAELQLKQKIAAADLIKPGTLLIPREQLIRVAKEAETIEIEEKKSQVHILAAGTTFRLNKPAVEPPERESVKDAKSVFMRGGELKQLLKHTRSFASRDPSRMSLNGTLLERRPREIRAAATDGHRLSLSTLAQANGNEAVRVVIPPEVAQLILGVATDEDDVEIRIGENTIEASGPKYEILGALLQGGIPGLRKGHPDKEPSRCKDRKEKAARFPAATENHRRPEPLRLKAIVRQRRAQARYPKPQHRRGHRDIRDRGRGESPRDRHERGLFDRRPGNHRECIDLSNQCPEARHPAPLTHPCWYGAL